MKNNIDHQSLEDFLGPAQKDGVLALAELGLSRGAMILDIGTGVGISAIFLAMNEYTVITGEPANDDSVYAKMDWESNAERFGVREHISFKAFNAQSLPFEPNIFDAVFFFGTLHHIDEQERKDALAEALRVCKKKGAVVFFEPNEATLTKIRKRFPEHPLAANPIAYINDPFISIKQLNGAMMNIYILTSYN